jgi:hypothetical protein
MTAEVMSDLSHAQSFRDLIVYQKAFQVAKAIFEISKGFPKEETYSLTDQIRRASRSIGAQIAEAWGKRRYEKHINFAEILSRSYGRNKLSTFSLITDHWLLITCSPYDAQSSNSVNYST